MEVVSKKVGLKKGQEYKFCICDSSETIPFCNKSHKLLNEKTGSNFKSLRLIPEQN